MKMIIANFKMLRFPLENHRFRYVCNWQSAAFWLGTSGSPRALQIFVSDADTHLYWKCTDCLL